MTSKPLSDVFGCRNKTKRGRWGMWGVGEFHIYSWPCGQMHTWLWCESVFKKSYYDHSDERYRILNTFIFDMLFLFFYKSSHGVSLWSDCFHDLFHNISLKYAEMMLIKVSYFNIQIHQLSQLNWNGSLPIEYCQLIFGL